MQLHLIRHGDCADSNGAAWLDGYPDQDLTTTGEKQILALARRLSAFMTAPPIYASDLHRTRRSAAIIQQAVGGELRLTPALREIQMGSVFELGWEGLRAADSQFYQAFQTHTADLPYPGGEAGADVLNRCQPLLESVAQQKEKHILFVSHGGTIMILLAAFLGMHQEQRFKLQIDRASLSTLSYTPESATWTVLRINDTAHLES